MTKKAVTSVQTASTLVTPENQAGRHDDQLELTANINATDAAINHDSDQEEKALTHEERVACVQIELGKLIHLNDVVSANADIDKANTATLTSQAERLFNVLSIIDSETVVKNLLNEQSGTITKTQQQSRKRLLVKAFGSANKGLELDIGHTKKSGYFVHALEIPVLTDREKAEKAFQTAIESAIGKIPAERIEFMVKVALGGIDALL